MPQLFAFSDMNALGLNNRQDTINCFGPKSTDLFRSTSSFTISAAEKIPIYSAVKGTVLLQDAGDGFVNLILRPVDFKEARLPVKYFIYRNLDINDFLSSADIQNPGTIVKTSGTEFLAAIQVIQQHRAPGTPVPVQALFGYDLNPALDKNVDDYFFKIASGSFSLFTIEAGIQLGFFYGGTISTTRMAGFEVFLENPENFITVEIARQKYFEISIPGSPASDLEKRWNYERARQYVDPAAFYGLHHDIESKVGYRTGTASSEASNATDVYTNIQTCFSTKNSVYLDIRNENEYSYNYYNNYIGPSTSADKDKELKIGDSPTTLITKEYYTDGWPIHIGDIGAPGSTDKNTFFISLRINDNEKPLLAINKIYNTPAGAEKSKADFIDETQLLSTATAEWTNSVSLSVPNIAATHIQPSIIVRLDYYKQIRINDGQDSFPYREPTDHLWGPINIKMPWDSANNIQWISANHQKYYDDITSAYVTGNVAVLINDIQADFDPFGTPIFFILVNGPIYGRIGEKIEITNTSNSPNVGEYTVIGFEITAANKSKIQVKEAIDEQVYTGDTVNIEVKVEGSIDYALRKIIVPNVNLSSQIAFGVAKEIFLSKKENNLEQPYKIVSNTYVGTTTQIVVDKDINKIGVGAVMNTGLIVETDTATGQGDNDRILFFAVPETYYQKNGNTTGVFNFQGGTDNTQSFFEALKITVPSVVAEKIILRTSSNINIPVLRLDDANQYTESIYLCGLRKTEYNTLNAAASSQLSTFHIQFLRIIPIGNVLSDLNNQPYYKYKAVISGFDNAGIYKEAEDALNPIFIYSRNQILFTSAQYASATEANAVELNYEEKYHLTEKTQYVEGNYSTQWAPESHSSTFKHLYEVNGADVKQIVDQFTGALNGLLPEGFELAAENLIRSTATLIIDKMDIGIKDSNSSLYNKDGVLDLARLSMRKAIKECSLVSTLFISSLKVQSWLDTIEKITRRLDKSNWPNFSTHPGHIPILITGFDPFKAAMHALAYYGLDADNCLSNPSGNIALSLHNTVINYPDDTNITKRAIIKSAIIPTRYGDFNAGLIENFFEPYINPNHPDFAARIAPNTPVKMIITFSYGIDQQHFNFELERFASRYRSLYYDNVNAKGTVSNYLNLPDKNNFEFIETTLPLELCGEVQKVGYDQGAKFDYYFNNTLLDSKTLPIPGSNIDKVVLPTSTNKIPSISLDQGHYPRPGANKIKSVEGSGGNYLSNEIFYRVSFLREKYNHSLRSGHIHVGFNHDDQESRRTVMLSAITLAIRQALAVINL